MSFRSSLARAFGRGAPLEHKSITLTDPAALALFGVQPVASGMTVTAASAMRVPAVRRAVSLIAESVACLPFKVYWQDSREAAKDHPAFSLVHDHANDCTSAEAFREHLTADALLTGHGYAQVARNAEDKPVFMLRMEPAVLDEGMEFQEIALKLADAEFSEVRREQVREIARAFGVPPASLFEMSRATWSNYEQAQREFLTGTLRPWIARWQAAYSRCLLTAEERGTLYVEGNPDDMLSVDHAARATAFSQYRSMGVLTGNEVRASMNRPPLPGGDQLSNPFTSTGADAALVPASPTQDDDA